MAEPPPQPSIPARLIGSGARRVAGVAGATGLDRALEEAIADAIVRTVESPAFERAVTEVLEGPTVERAVEQAMRSEAVERALTELIDSEMIDRVWERLLASDEAQKLVERIAEAPEVRAAIAQQGVGLLSDLGRHIGEVARKFDDIVERVIRRVTFARARVGDTERAGAVSRLLAFAVDGVLLNLGVLALGAIVSFLINSIFGEGTHREGPLVALGVSTWVFLAGLYLVTFWRFEGETPGMRFIGLNLEVGGVDEHQLGGRKAIARLFWLLFSLFPCFGLPLLGVIRRDDRSGLHDRRTNTTIVYKKGQAYLAPWTIEGRGRRGSTAKPAIRPGGQTEGDMRSL